MARRAAGRRPTVEDAAAARRSHSQDLAQKSVSHGRRAIAKVRELRGLRLSCGAGYRVSRTRVLPVMRTRGCFSTLAPKGWFEEVR